MVLPEDLESLQELLFVNCKRCHRRCKMRRRFQDVHRPKKASQKNDEKVEEAQSIAGDWATHNCKYGALQIKMNLKASSC